MKSTLKFIPLMMLFAFLITCNNIQANQSNMQTPFNSEDISVQITPNDAKMTDEVMIVVELHEKYQSVNLIGLELWREEDTTTTHQRIDVTRKNDGKFYYKTYFEMPGTYKLNVHVLINGNRKVSNQTFNISS